MNESEKAIQYIVDCCPNLGSFLGLGDVFTYLRETSDQMDKSKPSSLFPERYKEHVTFALGLVSSHGFLSPPAAVASVYQSTRFEFYFRILSGKLNGDGSWLDTQTQTSVQSQISDKRLKDPRIFSVALTYKILKLNKSLNVVQAFDRIDTAIYSKPLNPIITNLGERIEWARHRVAHGEWGDISAESIFYGLLTSLIFYNQT